MILLVNRSVPSWLLRSKKHLTNNMTVYMFTIYKDQREGRSVSLRSLTYSIHCMPELSNLAVCTCFPGFVLCFAFRTRLSRPSKRIKSSVLFTAKLRSLDAILHYLPYEARPFQSFSRPGGGSEAQMPKIEVNINQLK